MTQEKIKSEVTANQWYKISLVCPARKLQASYFCTPQEPLTMLKRSKFETTQSQIMHRAEDLISAASNRYRITVQVANRAKRRRYEDFDNAEDAMMKPVLRAIIEMSDELTQPEIIGEL